MNTIRTALVTTALIAASALVHAHASDDTRHSVTISADTKDGDGPERISPRQRPVAGKPHLVSTNRWSEILLKDNAVYLQMTDAGLKDLMQPQAEHDKDEGFFGNIVKAMALSGVKQVLDHSITLALTDTRSALVRDGEVIFVTCQGKEIFNKVKINDQVQKYPQASAEEFVRSINRLRASLPACRT